MTGHGVLADDELACYLAVGLARGDEPQHLALPRGEDTRLRWRNGQVVQGWNEFDAAAVAAQMAPTAPTAAGDDLAGRPAVKPA